MQLHYIWTKDFKNIHQQGFKFSDEYTIDYSIESTQLFIQKNNYYIPNFFPENITSVTGIIGANGAGKSNLFEFIKYTLASFSEGGSSIYDLESIVIFDNMIFCHENITITNEQALIKDNFKVCKYKDSISNHKDEDGDWIHHDMRNTTIFENAYVYYSNIFDLRDENYTFELINISTNHLIWEEKSSERYKEYTSWNINEEIDSIAAYNIAETNRQLEFLSENKTSLPFALPSSIAIRIEEKHNKYLDMYGDKFKKSGLSEFMDVNLSLSYTPDNTTEQDDLKQKYKQIFIYKLLIILQYLEPDKFKEIKTQEFEEIIHNGKYDLFDRIYQGEELENLTQLLSYIDLIITNSEAIKQKGSSNHLTYKECYDLIVYQFNPETEENLLNFFKYYNKTVKGKYFLAFYWNGLSSGEQTMLNTYSRFNYAFKRLRLIESKHVVIMIDEGETTLHPSWQMKFLNDIMKFFNQQLAAKTVQIIASSHSPFLVSDLPKSMINFLDRDSDGNCIVVDGLLELKQTFGANIHTLYSDAFFMRNTLMGDFAKEKLNRLINVVSKEKEFNSEFPDWDTVQKHIDIIGEPILKGLLQRQLNSIRIVKDETINEMRENIYKLQQRIEKLEKDDSN